MQITELNIYPVKSMRGMALDHATLTRRGLAFDRQWMVVDAEGRFVTQRELAVMAQVRVSLTADALVLEHESADAPLSVALKEPSDAPRYPVRIFKDRCEALDEGPQAAEWLSHVLGAAQQGDELRLVRFPEDACRPIEPDYLRGVPAETGFADGYAFLITSEASLEALNARLADKGETPLPMTRFRPNIVVNADIAFDERHWDEVRMPETAVRLGLRKPCKRCKIVTQDQQSGAAPSPKEPLKTLVEMQTQPGWKGAYFGQNAILLSGESQTLRVGEPLEVVRRE